ncbi:iron-sulfur cluster assembly scaffold protein [Candidatus Pacearchaeota archaeon]|nr:iron-sulfur cluster assembly scaffold protein [Candidatus Pacearchaeota archaeon]
MEKEEMIDDELSSVNELKVIPMRHKDVEAKVKAGKVEEWFYTDIVKDHFFNPRNLLRSDDDLKKFAHDGYGSVGAAACGDKMDMWIKIDKENDKIIGCLFKTFGCGSAIASTSMLTVMITENGGMLIEQALKIKPQDIVKRLGDLPQRKFHCSVLGDKSLRQAINDYFRRTGQNDRIVIEGAQVVDMALKITDKDIEEAVLDGAHDFEAVQKKTKVGVHDKSCIPKVKELIEFYKQKYYGG